MSFYSILINLQNGHSNNSNYKIQHSALRVFPLILDKSMHINSILPSGWNIGRVVSGSTVGSSSLSTTLAATADAKARLNFILRSFFDIFKTEVF